MPNTNLVAELNSLDFSVYIGGPLQAAVQAQTAASMAQVSFIQNVGFEAEDSNHNIPLRYVDFNYQKSVPNPHFGKTLQQLIDDGTLPAGTTSIPANIDTTSKFTVSDVSIKVPFLTMLTIPALRIEELTIDFNAKLTSTETASVSDEFSFKSEFGLDFKVVNFKASAAYKRNSSSGVSVEKTYNLGVIVRAVNDELPAGLDRILTMLEDSIVSA